MPLHGGCDVQVAKRGRRRRALRLRRVLPVARDDDALGFEYNAAIAQGRPRARIHNPLRLFKICYILSMTDGYIYES